MDEDSEKRIMIHVHDIKPPFLDGKVVYTTQLQPVQIVKDPNSDMAILAKKGSETLMLIRERQDKTKMRERAWELQGSKYAVSISRSYPPLVGWGMRWASAQRQRKRIQIRPT